MSDVASTPVVSEPTSEALVSEPSVSEAPKKPESIEERKARFLAEEEAASEPKPKEEPSSSEEKEPEKKPEPKSEETPKAKSEPTPPPTESKESKPEEKPEAKEPAPPKKYKIKINGQEREIDEAELVRKAQMAEAAAEKFQAASHKEKQLQAILQAAKEDPRALLKHLGINEREWAEQYLTQEIDREMMDPKDRELADLRAREAQRVQQEQDAELRRQQEAQEAEIARAKEQYVKEFDRTITSTLEQSGLPKTPLAVKRVVDVMRSAMEQGYELTPEDAAAEIQRQYHDDLNSMVGELDGEGLVKFFGEDVVKKIRKYDLARLRAAKAPAADNESAPQAVRSPRSTANTKLMSPTEWKAHMRRKAGLPEEL